MQCLYVYSYHGSLFRVLFPHTQPGVSESMFAIDVAQLCGVHSDIIKRAQVTDACDAIILAVTALSTCM